MLRMRNLGLVAMLAVVALVASLLVVHLAGGAGSRGGSRDGRHPAARSTGAPDASEVLPRDDAGGSASDPQGEELAKRPDTKPSRVRPGANRAKPSDTGALVSTPLPRNAARQGRLVAGYPKDVFATVSSTRIGSSSVSSSGARLQVALVATTTRSPGVVALFYRQSLARLGFKESKVASVSGSRTLAFKRGKDSVAITTTAQGRATTSYSLLGTLHAGRS